MKSDKSLNRFIESVVLVIGLLIIVAALEWRSFIKSRQRSDE